MRRKQVQEQKPIVKETPRKMMKPLPKDYSAIESYFKDKNSITNSVTSLVALSHHPGWLIIQAYLTDTRLRLESELLHLDPVNDTALSIHMTRIQEQLNYINYLLNLPRLIVDSYNEDTGSSNLDPYGN